MSTGPGSRDDEDDDDADGALKTMDLTTDILVDGIVDHHTTERGTQYRVRWYGYEAAEDN